MRVQLAMGAVWLLFGLGRVIGMLTATRDLIGWDWALTGGFFALSLLYFGSAYVKAKRDRRVVP